MFLYVCVCLMCVHVLAGVHVGVGVYVCLHACVTNTEV